MATVTLTREAINLGRNGSGAITRKQAAILGVAYPLPKGWLSRLVGVTLDERVYAEYLGAKRNRASRRGCESRGGSGVAAGGRASRGGPVEGPPKADGARVRGGIVLAFCSGCGERDQWTRSEQWTGAVVPPWNDGKPPRCGFCRGVLNRQVAAE